MPKVKQVTNTVKIVTYITPDLYNFLLSVQTDLGLAYEADIVRLALTKLKKEFPHLLTDNNKNTLTVKSKQGNYFNNK